MNQIKTILMKKITLLFLMTFLYSSFSFGQYLSEGFESGTAFPDDWVLTQTNSSQTWVISAATANTGSNSATVAYDLAAQDETLTSPSINLSSATNPRLMFSWNMSYYWSVDPNNNYDFIVSVDDGTDITQVFTEADAGVFTNFIWYEKTIDLSAYAGQSDVKIIFNYSGADGASLNIDDILIEETPSCLPVTSLTASPISPTDVEISWVAGGSETEWTYEWGITGFTQGSGTLYQVSNNSLTIDTLTPGETYDIYVIANCVGDDDSGLATISWTMPFTPPSNDDCDDAISLTVNTDQSCSNVTAGTNLGATASSQVDDVTGTPNNDVWFSFIATGTDHKVSLSSIVNQGGGTSTSTDMGMGVYDATGGCDALVLVADSDPNELILSSLTPSNTYLVRVYGWYSAIANNNFNICVGSPSPPIVPNYSEDFSNYPGDWTEANGAYMAPSGSSSSFSSGNFAYDSNNINGASSKVNIYGGSIDEYLISPQFNLSGATYYLNYDVALTGYNSTSAATLGTDDYVALLVTQDGGSSWQELFRWDSTSTISNTGQSAAEITLSSYGDVVQFAYYAFSDTSNEDNDFYIDNFQITTTTLGVANNSIENFNLFPTLVKDKITFTSQETIDVFEVYNLLGQQVFSEKVNTKTAEINLTTLAKGVYIVKVQSGDSRGSYKIIKE
tara:strand:+ start:17329 stop:19353 length:2025 start_codon:yes stop_codon:yes gene_type:complete